MAEQKFPLSLIVRAIDKASGPLRSITANINAQTAPLRGLGKDFKGLGEALHLEGAGKAISNVGSTAWATVARLAGLALGAGVAFGVIVKGATDAGDKLGEMADRVGLSVDSYASLQFAAAQADVEQEAFASGMDKLNKQLGDMKTGKGGKFLAFLNEISPTFAKQVKGAKTTEEAFFLLTDAMAKLPDEQRQAKLAAEAFGKSNTQMGRFMHQGTKAILEQEAEFMRLSGSQEAFARNSGELDNATRKTETAFLGLRNAAVGALAPALTKIANAASEFLVKNRDGLARWAEDTGAKISAWVDRGGMDQLAGQLGKVADGVGKVIDFLGPMGVAIAAGAVAFGPLAVSLLAAIPPLALFGAAAWTALAPILPFVAAGVALAIAGKQIYDAWGPLQKKFEDFGDTLRWAVVDGWKEVRPIISAMSNLPGIGLAAGAALRVGDSAAGQASSAIEARTGQSMAAIEARQARADAPFSPAGPTGISLSQVSVKFDNLPAGARVSQSGAPTDLSLGHSVQP